MKLLFVLGLCLLPSFFTVRAGDIISTPADVKAYEAYIKKFGTQKGLPFDEVLIHTAKYFMDKPYVASTLETSGAERLTVNLREFDCTTFVENCIVLAGIIKSGDFSYPGYTQKLMEMRYRNGVVSGYPSRLHYTRDWIYENEKRGVLSNISVRSGGQKVRKTINFMTAHPESYKHLKNNPRNISRMEEIEKDISSRNDYAILPADSIENKKDNIKSGDIIVFATSLDGLDYSHIGIAYWQDGDLHFIHASSRYMKVVIESKTLSQYCRDSKNCTGVSVLRINQE